MTNADIADEIKLFDYPRMIKMTYQGRYGSPGGDLSCTGCGREINQGEEYLGVSIGDGTGGSYYIQCATEKELI